MRAEMKKNSNDMEEEGENNMEEEGNKEGERRGGGKMRREEKTGENDAERTETSMTRRGAEGRDDKEGGDDKGGDEAREGGNRQTRQVESRTMEQSHMALLLVFFFCVDMYLGPSAHTICVGIQ